MWWLLAGFVLGFVIGQLLAHNHHVKRKGFFHYSIGPTQRK